LPEDSSKNQEDMYMGGERRTVLGFSKKMGVSLCQKNNEDKEDIW